MEGIVKVCNELTTCAMLRVQLNEKKYNGLKNLVEDGWVSCDVRFGTNNQLVLYLAIGETMRQGKIVVPADTIPEMMGPLVVADDAEATDSPTDVDADAAAGDETEI